MYVHFRIQRRKLSKIICETGPIFKDIQRTLNNKCKLNLCKNKMFNKQNTMKGNKGTESFSKPLVPK